MEAGEMKEAIRRRYAKIVERRKGDVLFGKPSYRFNLRELFAVATWVRRDRG